jgi:radical SAM protein with 4Fe4S-binding SPASM domain
VEVISSLDTVYLHVTKACNLHCVYCYFSAGESFEKELSTEEMLMVLRDASLLNPRRIIFTGGEPLLRNDILELAQSLRKSGNDIKLCLTTNGTLINEENASDLVHSFHEIRVSIDGFGEVNEKLRGKETFEGAMNAFRCILKAGGDPVAFITVTSLNLPHLKDFMHFMLRNGILRIHISPLRLAGRARDQQIVCNPEEVERTVEEFWYETFGLHLKHETKEKFNCGVGKFLTVYPEGSVYPCHLLAFKEFCIGNVREKRLISIYTESKLMNKLRNLNFKKLAQCSECFKELSNEVTCLGTLTQRKNFRESLVQASASSLKTMA